MDTAPAEGIQVSRQCRHQCLALTGFHFGYLAVMQHHAADQLTIEMPHAQRTNGRFTDQCESFRQQVVQG